MSWNSRLVSMVQSKTFLRASAVSATTKWIKPAWPPTAVAASGAPGCGSWRRLAAFAEATLMVNCYSIVKKSAGFGGSRFFQR